MRMTRILSLLLCSAFALFALMTSCHSDEDQPKLPVITSFSPQTGEPGTLITIKGANFTITPTFYVNNVKAALSGSLSETSVEIGIIVPTGATSGKIKLETKEGSVESADIFNLIGQPSITSFSPATGETGTEVVINGTNFTETTEVKFNTDRKAQITSRTDTRLTVLVPQFSSPGKFIVSTAGGSVTSATDFIANPPVITAVLSASTGFPVTVTGPSHRLYIKASHLSGIQAENKVKLNGKEVAVTFLNSTNDQLTVVIPSGASTGKISLTIGNYTTEYSQVIEVPSGEWKQLADFPHSRTEAKVFVIGNAAYYGGTSNPLTFEGDIIKKDFWKFSPATNSWTPIADIGGIKNNYSSFSVGNKGYVGGLYDELWEYNSSTDVWTKKATPLFYSGKAVGVNGKGYLLQDSNITDFSEYDPASDKWTSKSDLPLGSLYYPAVFVLNNKIYVVCGMTDSGKPTYTKDVYAYDPATDKWTKKADYPGSARERANAFVVNGFGYVGGGQTYIAPIATYFEDVWRYDDTQDKWFPSVPHPGIFQNSFAIGNKAYSGLMGGPLDRVGRNFFYEFTP